MENRINPLTIKRYENELVKMIAYFMTHQNCSLLEAQIRVNSILNSEQVHAKAIDWVEKTNRINSLQ